MQGHFGHGSHTLVGGDKLLLCWCSISTFFATGWLGLQVDGGISIAKKPTHEMFTLRGPVKKCLHVALVGALQGCTKLAML